MDPTAARPGPVAFDPRHAAAIPLTWALTVATLLATIPTLTVPGLLRGPEVMNGSARGTALVMLVVAAPLTAVAMTWARRGSHRALPLWIGGVAYLTYNAVMLLLGEPFNAAFLAYDAVLGLGVWTAITLLHRVDPVAYAAHVADGVRIRLVAGFLWVIVALNTLVWLRGIVPGMATDSPEFLRGTGLTTLPTYVQDLAFWLPLAALSGWWLWHGRPWGHLAAASVLVYNTLEAVGVAADQAWGHHADPASPVASAAVAPAFLVLAAVCALLAWHLLSRVDRGD